MTEFKEFKLGDLFTTLEKGSRLKVNERVPGNRPFVTAGADNFGVSNYISNDDIEIYPSNSLTIDMFGNVFYQPVAFSADDNISILYDDKLSKTALLYLNSVLQKRLNHQYGYSNQFRLSKSLDLEIQLPVKSLDDDEPDWDYMDDYIQQIQHKWIAQRQQANQERIAALDTLIGPALSPDDVDNILARYQHADFQDFKIGDLFDKNTVKGYPRSELRLTEDNNGFHSFGQNIKYQYPQKILLDSKFLFEVKSPILAFASSTGSIGLISESFYRSGDNGAFQALIPKFPNNDINVLLYLLTSIKKQFVVFGYNTNINNVPDLLLSLPTTSDGEPDYQLMEDYIKVIQQKYVRNLEAHLKQRIDIAKTLI